jgi:hypothetical protein
LWCPGKIKTTVGAPVISPVYGVTASGAIIVKILPTGTAGRVTVIVD